MLTYGLLFGVIKANDPRSMRFHLPIPRQMGDGDRHPDLVRQLLQLPLP